MAKEKRKKEIRREKIGRKISEKSISKKQEKQTKLIIIFMAVVIVSIFVFYWLSLELKKFDYAGLKFEKVKLGKSRFYLGKFPVSDVSGNVVNWLDVYFREDPRKLKNIEIKGAIKLKKTIGIAASSSIFENCSDSFLAAETLSLFLFKEGFNIFSGTANKTEAQQLNRTYISCGNENYSSIFFEKGDKNRIIQNNDCYTLEFANCEIMNVTERFMLGVYEYSRGI